MNEKILIKIILPLVIFIVICQLAGIIGSVFTAQSVGIWYAELAKPSFNPPNWVFGPVWLTLYMLMGIAAFLVWRKGWDQKQVKLALLVFFVQLVLNALWSFLFFGLQAPFAAFFEIMLLWTAILVTILAFYPLSRAAAYLLLPYFLWVSYAALLNFFLWQLN